MLNLAPLNNLMNSQMDRKQFLLYLGALILGIMGINSLIKLVANPHRAAQSGYSTGSYGGRN